MEVSLFVLLTLKLAGYFTTHIQARGEGGFIDPTPTPQDSEMAKN